jgi:hypothetical protein
MIVRQRSPITIDFHKTEGRIRRCMLANEAVKRPEYEPMFRPDRALDHYPRSVATLSKFNFSQLLATLNALGEDLSIYHSKRDMVGRICATETEVFEKDDPTSGRFHILNALH